MKYAIVILVVMFGGGCYLAYRLGVSDCRTDSASAAAEHAAVVDTVGEKIEQLVMSVPDGDNLDWLLQNWRRAD